MEETSTSTLQRRKENPVLHINIRKAYLANIQALKNEKKLGKYRLRVVFTDNDTTKPVEKIYLERDHVLLDDLTAPNYPDIPEEYIASVTVREALAGAPLAPGRYKVRGMIPIITVLAEKEKLIMSFSVYGLFKITEFYGRILVRDLEEVEIFGVPTPFKKRNPVPYFLLARFLPFCFTVVVLGIGIWFYSAPEPPVGPPAMLDAVLTDHDRSDTTVQADSSMNRLKAAIRRVDDARINALQYGAENSTVLRNESEAMEDLQNELPRTNRLMLISIARYVRANAFRWRHSDDAIRRGNTTWEFWAEFYQHTLRNYGDGAYLIPLRDGKQPLPAKYGILSLLQGDAWVESRFNSPGLRDALKAAAYSVMDYHSISGNPLIREHLHYALCDLAELHAENLKLQTQDARKRFNERD